MARDPIFIAFADVEWDEGTEPGDLKHEALEQATHKVPATPYTLHLLAGLPRRQRTGVFNATSASGHLSELNNPRTSTCKLAGLQGLTLHGLCLSFAALTEWLETPAGVVAQIQGHKPSVAAEKHYKVRPLELLRVHHNKIEGWILEQTGIRLLGDAELGKLRVMA